ncbi:hypothetical protein C8J57DRAFT_1560988 [Mycena rebaudengoi]|nr:hypothetical protein C8J57DRAFT_1560988 [Mycena rebaudengoi]
MRGISTPRPSDPTTTRSASAARSPVCSGLVNPLLADLLLPPHDMYDAPSSMARLGAEWGWSGDGVGTPCAVAAAVDGDSARRDGRGDGRGYEGGVHYAESAMRDPGAEYAPSSSVNGNATAAYTDPSARNANGSASYGANASFNANGGGAASFRYTPCVYDALGNAMDVDEGAGADALGGAGARGWGGPREREWVGRKRTGNKRSRNSNSTKRRRRGDAARVAGAAVHAAWEREPGSDRCAADGGDGRWVLAPTLGFCARRCTYRPLRLPRPTRHDAVHLLPPPPSFSRISRSSASVAQFPSRLAQRTVPSHSIVFHSMHNIHIHILPYHSTISAPPIPISAILYSIIQFFLGV